MCYYARKEHQVSRRSGLDSSGWTTGFTLVELLVVIGIIALLIAILLPSLNVARQSANRTACGAKLTQMGLAATIHASDHRGYYPLVGQLGSLSPQGLSDPDVIHYDYSYWDQAPADPRLLAPITTSLAIEMGYKNLLNNITDPEMASASHDTLGYIRNFLCPSQGTTVTDIASGPTVVYFGVYNSTTAIYYTQTQSYIFNEAVLGFDDGFARLRGQASRVRQPSQTMFAADGQGGSLTLPRPSSFFSLQSFGLPMGTVYNNIPAPVFLSDAFTGRRSSRLSTTAAAGDPQNFDAIRHKGRINILFCDGHVETRTLSAADLAHVYLLAS